MERSPYTFVAGLHGNETTPYFALCSAGIPTILGNPRAAFEGKRFIERDLNASFGCHKTQLIEERRAQELLRCIPSNKPVIDFHTFSCESEPFVVIVDRTQIALASMLGIKKIVLMSHNIKAGYALINHRVGVSVEVGMHGSESAWNTTLKVIEALKNGVPSDTAELHEVYGIIEERISRSGSEYKNFAHHPDGFIPVLAGEKAYIHPGLKSRLIDNGLS